MPLLKEQRTYTIEDIYALPEGQRAELIDGKIYDMAPPVRKHRRLISELGYFISKYIRESGGTCEVNPAPFQVRLNANDKTNVEPDLSVICDPDKLTDYGCEGAPDWIVEVVSPSTSSRDYGIKLFKYRSAGVREYWIVDPEKNRITVYTFHDDECVEYSFTDTVPVGIYEGDLKIDFPTLRI